jgi:hypothetical protein
MADDRVIAAILTLTLNSAKQTHPNPGPGGALTDLVMDDYKRFLKMVEDHEAERHQLA